MEFLPRYSCCHSAAISIHGKHLLTVGGVKESVPTSNIHMFNEVNHSWEIIGEIPLQRYVLAAVSVADNKIVVVGGYDGKQYTNTVWVGSFGLQ